MGERGVRAYKTPGAGLVHRGGMLRIIVSFTPDTFAEIRNRALKEQTSFAEQVRLLVEWGLMDAEDGARDG